MKKFLSILLVVFMQISMHGQAHLTKEETIKRFEALEQNADNFTRADLVDFINGCDPPQAWKLAQVGEQKRTLIEILCDQDKNDLVQYLVDERNLSDPRQKNEPVHNPEEQQVDDTTFHDLIVACVEEQKTVADVKNYFHEEKRGTLLQENYNGTEQSLYDWLLEKRTDPAHQILMVAAPYQHRDKLFLKMMIMLNVENVVTDGMYYLKNFIEKLADNDRNIDSLQIDGQSVADWLYEKAIQVPCQRAPSGIRDVKDFVVRNYSDTSYRARLLLRIMNPYRTHTLVLDTFFNEQPEPQPGWLIPLSDQDTDDAFCELLLHYLAFEDVSYGANIVWYLFVFPRSLDTVTYRGQSMSELWDELTPDLFPKKLEFSVLCTSGRTCQDPYTGIAMPDKAYKQFDLLGKKSIENTFFVPIFKKLFAAYVIDVDKKEGNNNSLGDLLTRNRAQPHVRELLQLVNPYRTHKLSADDLKAPLVPVISPKKSQLTSSQVVTLILGLIIGYMMYEYLISNNDDVEKSSHTFTQLR